MGSKDMIKRVKRKILYPFKTMGGKVKRGAEKFVLKTITKHGHVSSGAAGANALPGGQSPNLLISLMQSIHRTPNRLEPKTIQVVNMGDGSALVPHPVLRFVYVGTADKKAFARFAAEEYQNNITQVIENQIVSGDVVVVVGAGEGYHCLTIANVVGSSGKVFAVEDDAKTKELLEINIDCHEIQDVVTTLANHDLNSLELDSPDRDLDAKVVLFLNDKNAVFGLEMKRFLDRLFGSGNEFLAIVEGETVSCDAFKQMIASQEMSFSSCLVA